MRPMTLALFSVKVNWPQVWLVHFPAVCPPVLSPVCSPTMMVDEGLSRCRRPDS